MMRIIGALAKKVLLAAVAVAAQRVVGRLLRKVAGRR